MPAQYVLFATEGSVNQSFVQWTKNYWKSAMYLGLGFELVLGYISEQYRKILCPHIAYIIVGRDDNNS